MPPVVEVGNFDNLFAAMQAQGILANEGIEAEVLDQNMGTLLPVVGAIGVRVVVRSEDAERARAVLDAHSRQHRSDGASDAEEVDPEEGLAVQRAIDHQETGPVDVEAWARRTRALAICGIPVFLLAVGALFRVTSPPEGIERSPQAVRMLRQARWAVWAGVAVFLATVALLLL